MILKAASRGPKRRLVVFLWAGAVILLLLCSIHALPIPNSFRLVRVLADFGHAPVFAIVAIAALYVAASWRSTRMMIPASRDYVIAAVTVVLLASASELAQLTVPGRSASVLDFLRDLVGGSMGLLFCLWRDGKLAPGLLRQIAYAAVLSVLLLGTPIIWTLAGYVNRDIKWPTIVALDSPLDFIFLHPFESDIVAARPSKSSVDARENTGLLIRLSGELESGIMVEELHSGMAQYDRICVEVFNPNANTINATLWLGNNTSIVRSTHFAEYLKILPSESRISTCSLLIAGKDIHFPVNSPDKPHQNFRSLGLIAQPTGVAQNLILHRIWLE